MTDAELIAHAALINASCTEISSANQFRQMQDASPAYSEYADLHYLEDGTNPTAAIKEELLRRQKIRELVAEYRSTTANCLVNHPDHPLICQRVKDHADDHASIDQSDVEQFLVTWPRSADEPKLAAPDEDIPF